MNSKSLLVFSIVAFLFRISYAQQQDTTIRVKRDNIGDMNAPFVRAGEIPGAMLLPGTNVSLAIGGFIKATALFDTRYNVKNEIILPGFFSPAQITDGQTYIGARSSRLFFDGRSRINKIKLKGYFEMDFRGPNGFTLRHAYLEVENPNGTKLLMGQYWSLAMDLLTIPEGLVEPTVSGAPYARHGQIRFSGKLSKALTLSVSIEEPSNGDFSGTGITPRNKAPDEIAVLYIDPSPVWHFSVLGLYRPVFLSSNTSDSTVFTSGFLTGASMVLMPKLNNKFTLSGIYGKGASNYIMGSDGLSGYYDNGTLGIQRQYGGFAAVRKIWNEKFRSNVAFGKFFGDEIESFQDPHLRSSTFALINTFYHVNKYLNIGLEWIYTSKEFHGGNPLRNNRIQLGIQVF